MRWIISYLCVCVLAVIMRVVEGSRVHHHCPSGQFFNRDFERCNDCSSCPVNTIIRRPCHKDKDTTCGPFSEFDKFHQASQTRPLVIIDETKIAEADEIKNKLDETTDAPEQPVEIIREGPWYTLAMALLGVLCFVSVFLAIYVIVACYICRRRREEKEIIYDAELCPQAVSNPYVQTYIPARDRLKQHYTSKTVEDSDDSGSAVPNQFLALPPGLGYVDTSDYDADNSGQTASTGSTDYVYFKTNNASKV